MPHVNNHRSDDQRDCVWSLADVGFFYRPHPLPRQLRKLTRDRGPRRGPACAADHGHLDHHHHRHPRGLLPATAIRVAARELATAQHTGQPVPDAVDRLLARHEGEDTERDDCAVQTRHLDQPCHPGAAVG